MGKFSRWFWNPDFWLPVNFTWDEIQPREDFKYPNTKDILIYPFYVAFVLLIIRYTVIEPYIFYPLACYYKLNHKRPSFPERNDKFEKLYAKYNTNVPIKVLERTADIMNVKASYIQKWLRQRKAASKQTKAEKFSDNGFKLVAHGFYFLLSIYVMADKKWVWNISFCWKEYPHQEVDNDVWFYYMFGLGLYLSLTIYQLMQPSCKDRLSIYLHHFFTITLISLSWVMNLIRVGTLVILVHQCVDWILLTAKLLMYLKRETLTNFFFSLTFVVWIATRIILYPCWILRSVFFESHTYMFMPSAYLFFGLLLGLLFLNLMWLGMMLVVIYKKLKYGKLEDVRSSDEEDIEEEKDKKLQ